MSYYRKIVYLKKADHGIVMSNGGFARLEKRNGILMLHISVQSDREMDGSRPVYIIYERDAKWLPYQIGVLEKGEERDFCCGLEYLPRHVRAEEIGGVLVGIKDYYFWGSCGKFPDVIDFEQVSFASAVREVSEDKRQIAVTKNKEKEEQTEIKRGIIEESKVEKDMEQENKEEESNSEVNGTEKDNREKGEMKKDSREMNGPEHMIGEKKLERNQRAAYLRDLEEMYPFEDDEMEWCLQIKPEDFFRFPMEYWHYGKNSFLLEGFYNYRHLLYAHKEGREMIGVPGQFHRREQYLAGKFGFTHFKGIRKKRLAAGDYGYWLREL